MKGYLNLTVADLHRLLVDGRVTSLELVEEAIARLQADRHNVLEADCFEEARLQARTIDQVEEGEFFKGIPYLCKDNIATSGVETTASSNILNGYKPVFDATVVKKLKDAGAVLLGKTTLDELAMGGSGTTGHKGATTNPYDDQRIIGGSSCGSAAATAAGIVPFSLGSDTGDSVRKPAAYGGLVGYKPSWGRISRYGLFPFACSLDTVGFFTRSVFDAGKALELLAGTDPKDMSSSLEPTFEYSKIVRNSRLKVGYFPALIEDIGDPDIRRTYQHLLEELHLAGHEIVAYDFKTELLNAIYPTYMIISCSEATSNNANLDGIRFGPGAEAASYDDYIKKVRTAGFSDMIKRRFVIGSFSLLAENQHELFRRAQKARRVIVQELNRFFEAADALILPAAPSVAPLLADVSNSWSKHPDYLENHLGLANFAGASSMTLPMGLASGLPIAVNITVKPFADRTLFSLAGEVEDITVLKGLVKENLR